MLALGQINDFQRLVLWDCFQMFLRQIEIVVMVAMLILV